MEDDFPNNAEDYVELLEYIGDMGATNTLGGGGSPTLYERLAETVGFLSYSVESDILGEDVSATKALAPATAPPPPVDGMKAFCSSVSGMKAFCSNAHSPGEVGCGRNASAPMMWDPASRLPSERAVSGMKAFGSSVCSVDESRPVKMGRVSKAGGKQAGGAAHSLPDESNDASAPMKCDPATRLAMEAFSKKNVAPFTRHEGSSVSSGDESRRVKIRRVSKAGGKQCSSPDGSNGLGVPGEVKPVHKKGGHILQMGMNGVDGKDNWKENDSTLSGSVLSMVTFNDKGEDMDSSRSGVSLKFVTPEKNHDNVNGMVDAASFSGNCYGRGVHPSTLIEHSCIEGLHPSPSRPYILDDAQQRVVDYMKGGGNGACLGLSGTGKSRVVKECCRVLRSEGKVCNVVALNNVAAMNLGIDVRATTLHRLAGVSIFKTVRQLLDGMKRNEERWKEMNVLILVEIGMWNGYLLDWVDICARIIRDRREEVMGGIQLFVFGDFGEMAPIAGTGNIDCMVTHMKIEEEKYRKYLEEKQPWTGMGWKKNIPKIPDPGCYLLGLKKCRAYAFQSVCWREANFHYFVLDTVYGHRDPGLVEVLRLVRAGLVADPTFYEFLLYCSRSFEERGVKVPEGLVATQLFAKMSMAKKINGQELRMLLHKGRFGVTYDAYDYGVADSYLTGSNLFGVRDRMRHNADRVLKDCGIPDRLVLCKGAQVITTNCITDVVGRGARGVVEGFEALPVLEEVDPSDLYSLPRRHVVRGREKDRIVHDMRQKRNDRGQQQNPMVGDVCTINGKKWKVVRVMCFPKVKFLRCEEPLLVVPVLFQYGDFSGGKYLRFQIPLEHGWALTILKNQCMQCDMCELDLNECSEEGHAFCGFDRAKDRKYFRVKNYNASAVQANPLVIELDKAIAKGGKAVNNFLKEKAGLWFFPLLQSKRLMEKVKTHRLQTFSNCFRSWVAKYVPREVGEYEGWGCESVSSMDIMDDFFNGC